jgi:hypothetical protein
VVQGGLLDPGVGGCRTPRHGAIPDENGFDTLGWQAYGKGQGRNRDPPGGRTDGVMTESVKAPRRRPRLKGQAALDVVEVWWLIRPLPAFDSGWRPDPEVLINTSGVCQFGLRNQASSAPLGARRCHGVVGASHVVGGVVPVVTA